MKKAVINKGSSPRNVVGDLRFAESCNIKDFSLSNTTRSAEDSRQKHSGMTTFLMKSRAFTLIELLVVVLIIGILSAIALPQYQKAVMRAYTTQVFVAFNTYSKAIDRWILANGDVISERHFFTGPNGHDDLDISTEKYLSHYDKLGKMLVSAEINSATSQISIAGDSSTILGECGVMFQRRQGSSKWNMAGVYLLTTGNQAPEGQCEEFKQIMCQYWNVNGTGLGRSWSIAQCAKYGITFELAQ